VRFSAKYLPTLWRFVLYQISKKSQLKTGKKALFLAVIFPIEIRTISPIISLKCADFLALTPVYGVQGQVGIAGLGIIWLEFAMGKTGWKKVMTNQEIKEYKQKLTEIVARFNEPLVESGTITQELKRKDSIIGEFQDLARDIGSPAFLGIEIRDMHKMFEEAREKKNDREMLATIEALGKIHYQNILYSLQTEMMFNACIFAKRSCFWAAVAAIVALISVVLVLFCG